MRGYFAGLDVSDATTCICVINGRGTVVGEANTASTPTAIARELKPYARVLEKVGHESGSQSAWLHKELTRRRLPVVCLDARVTSGALRAQRNKTDKNDARAIAQVLRAGWYTTAYVKSDEALRIRLMLTHRLALRRKAADLENSLRHSLKAFGARLVKKNGKFAVVQSTRIADRTIAKLAQIMLRASAALRAEVTAFDKEILRRVKTDPVCVRLMTMPGVGPLTALSYKAAIDDPARFRSSRSIGAHFGLTPRRYQSGQTDYSGHISRIGDAGLRMVLYEAAVTLVATSKSKCRLRQWAVRMRAKHGMKFACVAAARKMAVILHRMWITERDFDDSAEPISNVAKAKRTRR